MNYGTIILLVSAISILATSVGIWGALRFRFPAEFFFFCAAACGFIGLLVSLCMFCNLQTAKHDAAFINKNYGTTYTADDFVWNGDEIKTMVIGNKSRVKIEN
jgi:hypothetical protein